MKEERLPDEVVQEIRRLYYHHRHATKNIYGIMSIIQNKGLYKFGRDYRKVIEKEISRANEERKLKKKK